MENPIKNGWFGGPTPIFEDTQMVIFHFKMGGILLLC